jgi:hypothetical protein
MGCDSWVFVHKHIAHNDHNNGRIIERKVLWNYASWEIGSEMTKAFALPNGTYRSTCVEDLMVFASSCLDRFSCDEDPYEHKAFSELKTLLYAAESSDEFFVSVDW